jgi:hypothetical protein
MTLRRILHLIFFSLFIIINLIIFLYLKLKAGSECDCANDKVMGMLQPLDYITWFSLVSVGLGIINIIIDFNRGFSSLPIIGTVFNLLVALACILQIALLSVFLSRTDKQQCKEINKCQDSAIKTVNGILAGAGYFIYLGAFILAILLVWL